MCVFKYVLIMGWFLVFMCFFFILFMIFISVLYSLIVVVIYWFIIEVFKIYRFFFDILKVLKEYGVCICDGWWWSDGNI